MNFPRALSQEKSTSGWNHMDRHMWSKIAAYLLHDSSSFLALKLTCKQACRGCRVSERELAVFVEYDGFGCWTLTIKGRPLTQPIESSSPVDFETLQKQYNIPYWALMGWFDRPCIELDNYNEMLKNHKKIAFWTTIGDLRNHHFYKINK